MVSIISLPIKDGSHIEILIGRERLYILEMVQEKHPKLSQSHLVVIKVH